MNSKSDVNYNAHRRNRKAPDGSQKEAQRRRREYKLEATRNELLKALARSLQTGEQR